MRCTFYLTFIGFLLGSSVSSLSQGWLAANTPTGIVEVKDMVTFRGNLFISTNPHVYSSGDNGSSWNLLQMPYTPNYCFLEVQNGELFVISERFVARSIDGINWSSNAVITTGIEMVDVAFNGNLFWAASVIGGLYSSADGITWSKADDFPSEPFYRITSEGSKLVASFLYDPEKIAVSTDGGVNWIEKSTGTAFIDRLTFNNNVLFSNRGDGTWRSENEGDNWQKVRESGILISEGNNLYHIGDSKVSTSSDNGLTWSEKSSQLPPYSAQVGSALGGQLFLGVNGGGIYSTSVSDPVVWQHANGGLRNFRVLDFEYHHGTLYMAASNRGVLSSQDEGQTWYQKSDAILPPNASISYLQSVGNDLFAFNNSNNLLRTSDGGLSWVNLGSIESGMFVNDLGYYKDNLVVAGSNGVFFSNDRGESWIKSPDLSGNIESITSDDHRLYCGGAQGLIRFNGSTQTWVPIPINGLNPYIHTIAFVNDVIVVQSDLGLLKSNDDGLTWTEADDQVAFFQMSTRYSGLYRNRSDRLYQSLNLGNTWQDISEDKGIASCFGFSSKYMFASFGDRIWYRPFQEFAPPFAEVDNFPVNKPLVIRFDHEPYTLSGNQLKESDLHNLFIVRDGEQNQTSFVANLGEDSLTILLSIENAELDELYSISIAPVQGVTGIQSIGQMIRVRAIEAVLEPPTDLVVNAINANQINLTWKDKSNFESGYLIEKKRSTDSEFTTLIVLPINTESYADLEVEPCTHYNYRVRTYSLNGTLPATQVVGDKTNCLPVGINFELLGTEDSMINFGRTNFEQNFSDNDSEDQLQGIKIQVLPGSGMILLQGMPVKVGDEIPVLQIDQMAFNPTENFNGEVEFKVLAYDGRNHGSQEWLVTINVIPVNDPPVLGNFENIRVELNQSSLSLLIEVFDIDNLIVANMLTGLSSNAAILKSENISFNDGIDGVYMTLTPERMVGTSMISITVNDGSLTDTKLFELEIFSVTGVKDNYNDQKFLIYPNPVDRFLTISENSDLSIRHITILDALGRKLINTGFNNTLDLGYLPTGVYIVELAIENGEGIQRRIFKK